jgi:hypothetical protein
MVLTVVVWAGAMSTTTATPVLVGCSDIEMQQRSTCKSPQRFEVHASMLVCVGMVAVMVAVAPTTTTTPVLATMVRCRDIWEQQDGAPYVDVQA